MTILTFHLSISILVSCHFESSPVATFSIIGSDPDTGELGVAVQSKVVAVGAVVPWARAGIGAVATQSFANVNYGHEGLDLLKKGKSPKEVIKLLKKMRPSLTRFSKPGMIIAKESIITEEE